MAGGDTAFISGDSTVASINALLGLVQDVGKASAGGFKGPFKKDCTDLARRIALLSHLFEEVRDFKGDLRPLDEFSSTCSCLVDLKVVVQATKGLLVAADTFDAKISPVRFLYYTNNVSI